MIDKKKVKDDFIQEISALYASDNAVQSALPVLQKDSIEDILDKTLCVVVIEPFYDRMIPVLQKALDALAQEDASFKINVSQKIYRFRANASKRK